MGQRNTGVRTGHVRINGGGPLRPAVVPPPAEATPGPAPAVARRGRLRAPVELEVIIPAYNESARLPETLRQSVAYLNERPWQSRIVVVDNGSVDETAADARVAAAATDKVDVVVIGCSRAGKGAAVRRGLLTSTSPLVGFYDADLATPLETLVPTVDALLAGADAVIITRTAWDPTIAAGVDRREDAQIKIGAANAA